MQNLFILLIILLCLYAFVSGLFEKSASSSKVLQSIAGFLRERCFPPLWKHGFLFSLAVTYLYGKVWPLSIFIALYSYFWWPKFDIFNLNSSLYIL